MMFCSKLMAGVFIFSITLTSVSNVNAQIQAGKNPAEIVKAAKYKGLQISRSDLITGLSSIDSLLHFKQVADIKGLPKFAAKGSYGTRVEITGAEDNVTKAQWAVNQPASGSLNKIAFTRMAFFVNMVGKQEAATWFFEQLNYYNQSPTQPLNNFYIIDGGKLTFTYDPLKKAFNITVTSQ